jgi:hypothetical protein
VVSKGPCEANIPCEANVPREANIPREANVPHEASVPCEVRILREAIVRWKQAARAKRMMDQLQFFAQSPSPQNPPKHIISPQMPSNEHMETIPGKK